MNLTCPTFQHHSLSYIGLCIIQNVFCILRSNVKLNCPYPYCSAANHYN